MFHVLDRIINFAAILGLFLVFYKYKQRQTENQPEKPMLVF